MWQTTAVNHSKNMKYCRYCGKTIDDDSSFCTHCGKNQDTQGPGTNLGSVGKVFSRFKEVIIGFVQSAGSKIKKAKGKSSSTDRTKIKKWAKRISLFVLALVVVGLTVLLGFWLYGFYQTSKWNKEDEQREAIALKEISKANEIAKELFEESANYSHHYGFDGSDCGFDHVERGIEIIRNAAEKGDAKAQFTLGCIYDGVRLDSQSPYWSRTTMMGDEINYERAAYWYNQAAAQGNPGALNNLANAYRKGNGVEKDLVRATELMRSAAEKGDAMAQLNYGDMFRDCEVWLGVEDPDGGGYFYAVPKHPMMEDAKKWWTKALENEEATPEIKASAKERLEKIYD